MLKNPYFNICVKLIVYKKYYIKITNNQNDGIISKSVSKFRLKQRIWLTLLF